MVESVCYIDDDITMPSITRTSSSTTTTGNDNDNYDHDDDIECHAVATKYYSPIPYFKPELRELRSCITPPPPLPPHKDNKGEEVDRGIMKHYIIASCNNNNKN